LNVVDSVLHCSGLKGMNEEEADQQLGKVIIIFKYLQVRHCPIIMSNAPLACRRIPPPFPMI
jgi:hypothetical protein